MTAATPISGVSPVLPKRGLRVSFDVDPDFLQEAQDTLFSAPRRIAQLGDVMDLLASLAQDTRYGLDDPRVKSAFAVASEAAHFVALRDGQMLSELLALIDNDNNIRTAG